MDNSTMNFVGPLPLASLSDTPSEVSIEADVDTARKQYGRVHDNSHADEATQTLERLATVEQVEKGDYLQRTLNAIREGTSVAGLLRMGGAALMVLSLSLFLMQGVEVASDLQRYLILLGQTLLLTTAGFAVGYLLKEPRGARVFFSLGLISIPANFAVLGAMIYSIAPLDAVITDYPAYASWHSTGLKELLIASGAGLAVLLPMSVFCFAVMARRSKWWLSAGYLLSCATLLIPVRETLSVTLISSVCALGMIVLLSNRQAATKQLATADERFAKALLFAPAALMLARSAMLYHVEFHIALAVVIAVYYLLRRVTGQRTDDGALSTIMRYSSAITATVLAIMLTSLVDSGLGMLSPLLVFALVSLAINTDLARVINRPGTNTIIHTCWAMLLSLAIILDTLLISGANGLLIDVVLAAILIAAGIKTRNNSSTVMGSLLLAMMCIVHGYDMFSIVLDTGWIGLAIGGATTIVAGSVLERYWPVIKLTAVNRFGTNKVANEASNREGDDERVVLEAA